MTGPLDGLRVVDLTQGYVGHCGMMFSDLGATVIKVEPPEGDYLRRLGPPFVGEDAAAFLGVNRGKQSVRLAWTEDPRAREALDALIADADVLISDLYPDEAEQHALQAATLGARHPRLVLCSVTPQGDSGPAANHRASELEVQGMSGQLRHLGDVGGPPVRMGIPVGALSATIFAFQGTLAALLERTRSGQGQNVEVSQLGSQITMQTVMFASESEPDEWIGHTLARYRPRSRGYPTRDRAVLWGFMNDPDALRTFCEKLGIGDVLEEGVEPGFGWLDSKRDVFEEAFRDRSADEICALVRELGGTAVPYHTFESLAADPQTEALGLISEFDYPGAGSVSTIGLAWEFSETPAEHGRPPLLGEHTQEVLAGLGLSPDAIEAVEGASAR